MSRLEEFKRKIEAFDIVRRSHPSSNQYVGRKQFVRTSYPGIPYPGEGEQWDDPTLLTARDLEGMPGTNDPAFLTQLRSQGLISSRTFGQLMTEANMRYPQPIIYVPDQPSTERTEVSNSHVILGLAMFMLVISPIILMAIDMSMRRGIMENEDRLSELTLESTIRRNNVDIDKMNRWLDDYRKRHDNQ